MAAKAPVFLCRIAKCHISDIISLIDMHSSSEASCARSQARIRSAQFFIAGYAQLRRLAYDVKVTGVDDVRRHRNIYSFIHMILAADA